LLPFPPNFHLWPSCDIFLSHTVSAKELLPRADMTAEKTRSNRLDKPEKKLITTAYSLLPILSENRHAAFDGSLTLVSMKTN
jgi:hypothetical protein